MKISKEVRDKILEITGRAWLHGEFRQNVFEKLLNSITADDGRIKRTSEEWRTEIYDFNVYDPDGWDRTNFQYSWFEEKITWSEYETRAMRSTVMGMGNSAITADDECPKCRQKLTLCPRTNQLWCKDCYTGDDELVHPALNPALLGATEEYHLNKRITAEPNRLEDICKECQNYWRETDTQIGKRMIEEFRGEKMHKEGYQFTAKQHALLDWIVRWLDRKESDE